MTGAEDAEGKSCGEEEACREEEALARSVALYLVVLAVCAVGFGVGWYVKIVLMGGVGDVEDRIGASMRWA